MSNISKELKELRELQKQLPSKEEFMALVKEIEGYQAEMEELVEKKKVEVLEVQKELFKAPTDEELHQLVADILSDDSKMNEFLEIIQNDDEYKKEVESGKFNGTSEEIIELFRHPDSLSQINTGVEKMTHALYRSVYKKLTKDLKFIKDSQVFTPQGRKSGRTKYEQKKINDVQARAKELGYYDDNLEYGMAKQIQATLVDEFEGLNTIDAVKTILKK